MTPLFTTGPLTLPHSSQWAVAFPAYDIGVHLVSDIVSPAESGTTSSFTAGGRVFVMPAGLSFDGLTCVFYRANHKKDPRHDFRFVTNPLGHGWETLIAADRPGLMAQAFTDAEIDSWALATTTV